MSTEIKKRFIKGNDILLKIDNRMLLKDLENIDNICISDDSEEVNIKGEFKKHNKNGLITKYEKKKYLNENDTKLGENKRKNYTSCINTSKLKDTNIEQCLIQSSDDEDEDDTENEENYCEIKLRRPTIGRKCGVTRNSLQKDYHKSSRRISDRFGKSNAGEWSVCSTSKRSVVELDSCEKYVIEEDEDEIIVPSTKCSNALQRSENVHSIHTRKKNTSSISPIKLKRKCAGDDETMKKKLKVVSEENEDMKYEVADNGSFLITEEKPMQLMVNSEGQYHLYRSPEGDDVSDSTHIISLKTDNKGPLKTDNKGPLKTDDKGFCSSDSNTQKRKKYKSYTKTELAKTEITEGCVQECEKDIKLKRSSTTQLLDGLTPRTRSSSRFLQKISENEDMDIPYTKRTVSSPRTSTVTKKLNNGCTRSIVSSPRTPSTKEVLRTPKHRISLLTPILENRRRILRTPSTPLDCARQLLHASSCPTSLPCREREFDEIFNFILCKMDTRSGGCMYISGMPGTGKTATVLRVIRKLSVYDDAPSFKFVEINSLQLSEQRQAYSKFWKDLTGQSLSVKQAQRALEKKFTSGKRSKDITVLLIDELEYLCNKRQDVIYNVLDWSEKQGAVLIILAVANTMDLPERTLRGKVTSRVGLTRVIFQPYSYQQLQKIVLDRLSKSKTFLPDAVQLAARKVAAVSGDARRALDICRRAVDIASRKQNDKDSVVTIADVEEAVTQILSVPLVLAIKDCSVMEQLVLRSIRDECLRIGLETCALDKMYDQFKAICTLEGLQAPHLGQVYQICTTLDDYGLIMADRKRNCGIKRKLSLNVSSDDIHYALMRS